MALVVCKAGGRGALGAPAGFALGAGCFTVDCVGVDATGSGGMGGAVGNGFEASGDLSGRYQGPSFCGGGGRLIGSCTSAGAVHAEDVLRASVSKLAGLTGFSGGTGVGASHLSGAGALTIAAGTSACGCLGSKMSEGTKSGSSTPSPSGPVLGRPASPAADEDPKMSAGTKSSSAFRAAASSAPRESAAGCPEREPAGAAPFTVFVRSSGGAERLLITDGDH
jgi:hypothetical protein